MPVPRALPAVLVFGLALALAQARPAAAEAAIAPIARIGIGPAFHTAPEREQGTKLAVEAAGGLNVATAGWKHSGLMLSAEGGYGYDGVGLHAAHVVGGIGYGHPLLFLSYHPRLILGSAGEGLAVGMRNGVTTHLLGDLGSIEIGHQVFHDETAIHQDVRLLFFVNPGALAFAISKL